MQAAREFQRLPWKCGEACSAVGAGCVEEVQTSCGERPGDPRYELECTVHKVVIQRTPKPQPMLGWLTGHRELLYVEIGDARAGKEGAKRTETGCKVEPGGVEIPASPKQSSSRPGSPSSRSPTSSSKPMSLKNAPHLDAFVKDANETWVWCDMDKLPQSPQAAREPHSATAETINVSTTLSSNIRLRILACTTSSVSETSPLEVVGEARFQIMNDVLPLKKTDGLLTVPTILDNRVNGQVWLTVRPTLASGSEERARSGILRECGGNDACIARRPTDVEMLQEEEETQSEPMYRLQGHEASLTCCAVFADGDRLLTGSSDKTARIWSKAGAQISVLKGHEAAIKYCAVFPGGDEVLTLSEDNVAMLWRIAGLKATQHMKLEDVRLVAVLSRGRGFAMAGSGAEAKVVMVDAGTHTMLKGHSEQIVALGTFPSSDKVLTASLDGDAAIWFPDGTILRKLKAHQSAIRCCAIFPAGDRTLTGSDDTTAIIWGSVESSRNLGKPLAHLKGHDSPVLMCTALASGERVATAHEYPVAIIWSVSGERLATLEGHSDILTAFCAIPSVPDQLLTVSRDSIGVVWSTSGQKLGFLRGHTASIVACAAFPNGSHAVTASEDQAAIVWSMTHHVDDQF